MSRKLIIYTATVLLLFVLIITIESVQANNTVYVSSSMGNDSNDGTKDSPYKTLNYALKSHADTILIKAGDIFYESISINGKVVDRYGKGENPILYGVKIPRRGAWENGVIRDNKWIKRESNIWRLNLSLDDEYYSGYKTGGSSFLNNAGFIVNLITNDMNNCRKVPNYVNLKYNFDFWQPCPVDNPKNSIPKDFDFLYLYFEGNPNDYDFGISLGATAVSIKNGEVRNLNIRYWGFGIIFYDNVKISNCEIDGIGGFIQRGSHWVLLGNGVESWITPPKRKNCLIENCNISRTFDSGATIQGRHSERNIRAEDILFRNNKFRNCCQSFEEFLRGPGDEDLYYNCVFENNISIDAGIDTGFRYYDNRYKRCHFLSNSNLRNTNLIIRNNTTTNGNYYCAGAYQQYYRQAQWQGNVCHIKRGQDLLGNYLGTKDIITVPISKGSFNNIEEATNSAISRYRQLTGDFTTQFNIIE